jgi:hypothetical protein
VPRLVHACFSPRWDATRTLSPTALVQADGHIEGRTVEPSAVVLSGRLSVTMQCVTLYRTLTLGLTQFTRQITT